MLRRGKTRIRAAAAADGVQRDVQPEHGNRRRKPA